MGVELDPDIRLWVIIPLTIINFIVNYIRGVIPSLFGPNKKKTIIEVKTSEMLKKVNLLIENNGFLTEEAFEMRRHFYINSNDGYLKSLKQPTNENQPSVFNDPSLLMDMMKSNAANVIIMLVLGQWVNSSFSGFVVTRVPFPLTNSFKSMLQNSVIGVTLDPSWVSAVSFYFLAMFGLKDLIALVSDSTFDITPTMDMSSMLPGNQNSNTLIDTCIETLSICHYEDVLSKEVNN